MLGARCPRHQGRAWPRLRQIFRRKGLHFFRQLTSAFVTAANGAGPGQTGSVRSLLARYPSCRLPRAPEPSAVSGGRWGWRAAWPEGWDSARCPSPVPASVGAVRAAGPLRSRGLREFSGGRGWLSLYSQKLSEFFSLKYFILLKNKCWPNRTFSGSKLAQGPAHPWLPQTGIAGSGAAGAGAGVGSAAPSPCKEGRNPSWQWGGAACPAAPSLCSAWSTWPGCRGGERTMLAAAPSPAPRGSGAIVLPRPHPAARAAPHSPPWICQLGAHRDSGRATAAPHAPTAAVGARRRRPPARRAPRGTLPQSIPRPHRPALDRTLPGCFLFFNDTTAQFPSKLLWP